MFRTLSNIIIYEYFCKVNVYFPEKTLQAMKKMNAFGC